MPFVKLDCCMLSSTIWFDREGREVFITALLMAEPWELEEPAPQIEADTLNETGWIVPPGWYGWVDAAGVGIIARAGVPQDLGMQALKRLAAPDPESRSKAFDGRRLVRVDGGYIVLNYIDYRERDYTSADRSRRYRERVASRRIVTPSHRDITQAEEAEIRRKEDQDLKIKIPRAPRSAAGKSEPPSEFLEFWLLYPKRLQKQAALKAWLAQKPGLALVLSALEWQVHQPAWTKDAGQFIPYPASWLNGRRWEDEPFQPPSGPLPSVFVPSAWRDECRRLHGDRCGNKHFHAAKMAEGVDSPQQAR